MSESLKLRDRISLGYILLGLLVVMIIAISIFFWGNFPVWYWFLLVLLLSIVIWKACDPFSEASFFLGRNIPGSVRGATIDAVASSMPEFFTVIFFLIIFDRYESGIATCAGSAIYNMIVIPAICTFFIFNYRKLRGLDTNLVVEKEVLYRDGLYFLFSEIVLISFISQGELTWWMGLAFILLYIGYAFWLWLDAKRHKRRLSPREKYRINRLCENFHAAVRSRKLDKLLDIWPDLLDSEIAEDLEEEPDEFWESLNNHIHVPKQNEEGACSEICTCQVRAQGGEDFTVDYIGGRLPGMLRLNIEQNDNIWEIQSAVKYDHTKSQAWMTILIATLFVALACYFLTVSCEEIANGLGITPFFVAVVIAAAATSVPDTFLSMLSARKGDDSGAVSNAFGSNIFDINIGLGVPLFFWTLYKGEPVTVIGEGVREVRIVLLALSAVTLIIFSVKMKLNRTKAIILFGLYGLFMVYAVMRGWLDFDFAELIF